MTAEGADRRHHWVARAWRPVQRLSRRTSLRTKLVTALLLLVIAALAAMAFTGLSLLRSELLAPYDNGLQTVGSSDFCMQGFLNGSGRGCGSDLYAIWLSSNGQATVLVTPASGYLPTPGSTPAAPDLSRAASWLAAHPGQPTTVPAVSGNAQWRVVGFPQQAVVNGSPVNGTEVIGTDVSGVYTTLHQLAWLDLIVSAVIVFVLAIVGYAVVRANLRPLEDIEETAGEIAEGHLNRRVPEGDPRTEVGSLGRSLNVMLSQIETAFHAREKSEAAAHQNEERMRRFIADASHELRTPLTAIRGFAEYYRQRGGLVAHWDREEPAAEPGALVMQGGLTPDDLDRIMQRVEKEAARMGLLVEDLLLLARLDQQRPLARQPIDLLSLAADAVHDARLLAPARTIRLSVQSGAAFIVIGDEPRLRQVIGNLMSNALTHTPDGTPIDVSIGSGTLDPRVPDSGAAVTLAVTDHGRGMNPEQAQRVFERFYRADQARTRTTGGSGLGLAIVNALVAAHGGVASVETAPGHGATFCITLPLAPEAQDGMAADDELDLDELGEADDELSQAPDVSVTYGTDVADRAEAAAGAGETGGAGAGETGGAGAGETGGAGAGKPAGPGPGKPILTPNGPGSPAGPAPDRHPGRMPSAAIPASRSPRRGPGRPGPQAA